MTEAALQLICIFGRAYNDKMSKLSFRARALDATKPMPVYKAVEIPDMPDFAAINRAVPQMPTGMDKEEETVSLLLKLLVRHLVFLNLSKMLLYEMYTKL